MIHFLQSILEFLIFTVVVKIIVGHWIAEEIMKWANKFFHDADRNIRATAIWQHYQDRARGHGHAAGNITECTEKRCAIFKTSLVSQAAQSTS